DEQLKVLADATVSLMVSVLQPLANIITTLPAGPGHEGKTAGPSFELFYEADYLLPHREAAWTLLTERLDEAASFCRSVGGDCTPAVAGRLTPVISALAGISATLAAHLPAGRSRARAAGMDQATLAAQLSRAADLARRALEAHGGDGDGLADLADRADAARRAVQEGATGDRSPGDAVWEAAQAATRIRAARA